jgi:hypothetical protein
MPPSYHVGLAIWPKKNAQWFELGLKAHPTLRVSLISNESTESGSRIDLLVIDGENPGPNFIAHYSAYVQSFGHCNIIVLGHPGCPALMTIDWDPSRTVFIAKPYLIEDVLKTIHQRLGEIGNTTSTPTSTPASASAAPTRTAPAATSERTKSLGYLSTLRLADLVQMLCLSNWTGKIDIQNLATSENGTVHIHDGVVIDALQGDLSAENACYRMLSWGRCQFEFTEDAAPTSRTIHTHWQGILLEGARLFDEGLMH